MAKILVAEDERDIRDLIAFSLNYGGFEVTVTNDGNEAVEKAQQDTFDLILMDVRMPRMTGYEACRKLKGIDKTRNIPIVFLSAKGQDTEIKQGIESGAVDYILKPFAPDQLIKQIKVILAQHGTT